MLGILELVIAAQSQDVGGDAESFEVADHNSTSSEAYMI